MTTVCYEIHLVRDVDVDELTENEIETRLNEGHADARTLVGTEHLEGALVIEADGGRAAIVDGLGSAVQRLCFEAVAAILDRPEEPYHYQYFTTDLHIVLTTTSDTVEVRGDDIPTWRHPKMALVSELYRCGLRYLKLVARLGDLGRAESAVDAAWLQPFAERARDALVRHRLAGVTTT